MGPAEGQAAASPDAAALPQRSRSWRAAEAIGIVEEPRLRPRTARGWRRAIGFTLLAWVPLFALFAAVAALLGDRASWVGIVWVVVATFIAQELLRREARRERLAPS